MSVAQAIALVTGASASVELTSTEVNGHIHVLTIGIDRRTAQFVVSNITNNEEDTHVALAVNGFSTTLNHTWEKGQRGAFLPIYSTLGILEVNLDDSNNFSHVLTEDTVLGPPLNAIEGQAGIFHFTQHSVEPKDLSLDSFWGFGVDTHIAITTTLSGTAAMSYSIDPGGASATCSWVNKS